MAQEHRLHAEQQVFHTAGAQCLTADHRADAADREEVHHRHRSAAPEKQRHDTKARAVRINGKCAEFQIERIRKRTQEEPVMVASRPDALADFGFICLFVVKFNYCRH